ncbi:hypothetical protein HOY80DRAFT_1036437 [Tuber brumale]|nr:hypothetical protein HOY80DRAFT_1036437 [Tuber brumale]
MSSPTTRATRMAAEKVFYTIRDAIKSGKPEVLQFANLDLAVSNLVLDSLFDRVNSHLEEHSFRVHFSALDHHLTVVMPNLLHEAAGAWLIEQYTRWRVSNLINSEASRAIMKPVSPRIDNFIGPYANTVKEPDFSFLPVGPGRVARDFPSVVLEAGWSSTGVQLTNARRIWHDGSGGRVMVVILIKLFKPNINDQIRVTLEISHAIPGAPFTVFTVAVFPNPGPGQQDPTLTIVELFGGQCPPNHDPQTVLPLELEILRENLETAIIHYGSHPA